MWKQLLFTLHLRDSNQKFRREELEELKKKETNKVI